MLSTRLSFNLSGLDFQENNHELPESGVLTATDALIIVTQDNTNDEL